MGAPGLSLVLQAAHTLLPEANVTDLPKIARDEVLAGLTGPLREATAVADEQVEDKNWLRDQIVKRLSGRSGWVGAIMVADQIHLRRLVQGHVPAIVTVECVHWYGTTAKTMARTFTW